MHHYLPNLFSFVGHLGSFQLHTMINNAAMTALIHFTFIGVVPYEIPKREITK